MVTLNITIKINLEELLKETELEDDMIWFSLVGSGMEEVNVFNTFSLRNKMQDTLSMPSRFSYKNAKCAVVVAKEILSVIGIKSKSVIELTDLKSWNI